MDVGRILWPTLLLMAAGTSAPAHATATTLSSTSHNVGSVWQARKAQTITHVLVRQGTLTGAPGTMRVGFRTVSGGLPTATWMGASNLGYATVTSYSSGNNGLWLVLALTEPVTLTRGQKFAIIVEPTSGTWDAGNSLSIVNTINNCGINKTGFPFVNGAKTTPAQPCVLWRTSTETFGVGCEAFANASPSSSTTPDEIGLKFTYTIGAGVTYQIEGLKFGGSFTASRTFDILLYDTDGTTVLQNVSVTTNEENTGAGCLEYYFDEDTLVNLSSGSAYRIVIKPTGTSTIGNIYTMPNPTAGDSTIVAPSGSIAYTTRTDAGAWGETTTTVPMFQLIISDITVPTSGLSAPRIGPGLLARAA